MFMTTDGTMIESHRGTESFMPTI